LVEPSEPMTFIDVSPVTACFRPESIAIPELRAFVERPWD
jgi:hypothetical protein